jgi:serine/threonine protein kinase
VGDSKRGKALTRARAPAAPLLSRQRDRARCVRRTTKAIAAVEDRARSRTPLEKTYDETPMTRDTVGDWQLVGQIGYGGNATVYSAFRGDPEDLVALKVLRDVDRTDTYQRFTNDVEILRRIGDFPGVLPLVDAHVPEVPTAEDTPWLAMPMATALRSALADADLDEVVTAIAEVAETLAELRSKHELGHRDIKPANLYQ